MQLYAITDRHQLPGSDPDRRHHLVELTRTWAKQNIDYIQIREKDLPPNQLRTLAAQIVAAVRSQNRSTRVLLNGPAEIALEAKADGVHLLANAPANTARHARELFARHGREAILSYACHSREEILKAKEESQQNPHATTANTLILYAPVFEKPIPGHTPLSGHGLDALSQAVEAALPVPVFALGGVTFENAPACIAVGATGIAGIRLFLDVPASLKSAPTAR